MSDLALVALVCHCRRSPPSPTPKSAVPLLVAEAAGVEVVGDTLPSSALPVLGAADQDVVAAAGR